MRALIDGAEAPFLRTLLSDMPTLVTTDEVMAAADAGEVLLASRGIPQAQRPGHRFTFEAAYALVTVERAATGWSLDAIEEVAP